MLSLTSRLAAVLLIFLSLSTGSKLTLAQNSGTQELDRLIRAIKTGDQYERASAAARLLNLAEHYERFAKPLAALLIDRDEVVSGTAKRIYVHLGKKAVDALNPDLDSTDLEHIRLVCSAINAVGDSCEEYKPKLVEMLRERTDPNFRVAATFALTGFSDGCPEAIDHILRDLENRDMNVTLFAARLIIKTGDKARQAIPNLVKLLENGVISQRGYAIWALAAIGPTDEFDTLAATEKLLNKFHVVERERALIAAGLLGKAAASLEPKVREMMGQDYSNLEGQGAVTLWQITGDAADSIERLVQISTDFVEYEVTGPKLLGELGPAAAPAAGFLVERLGSSDLSVQIVALDSLGDIGPAACEHRDKIAEFVSRAQSPLIQMIGNDTLKKIDAGDK